MEKKIKFSNKPLVAKIVYASVIAILCITAIVVGIVSAASKTNDSPTEPPINDGNNQNTPSTGDENKKPEDEDEEEKKLCFVSPIVGTVVKEHSLEVPVYSTTLGEWRVHTGIDISAEDGAAVYASEDGTISAIYSDPMLGYTVEITHKNDIKTRYSNLAKESVETLKVGAEVKSGDKIGAIGDTSISELAEEPHLHFEVLLKNVKVNPMDYISEESKNASLGIK